MFIAPFVMMLSPTRLPTIIVLGTSKAEPFQKDCPHPQFLCLYVYFQICKRRPKIKGEVFEICKDCQNWLLAWLNSFAKSKHKMHRNFNRWRKGNQKFRILLLNCKSVLRPHGLSLYRYMKTILHKRTEPQFVLPCSLECINLRLLARRHLTVAGQ